MNTITNLDTCFSLMGEVAVGGCVAVVSWLTDEHTESCLMRFISL